MLDGVLQKKLDDPKVSTRAKDIVLFIQNMLQPYLKQEKNSEIVQRLYTQ